MGDRLLSGHAPLDDVLGGGLPANAISLIMGRPGTGKTILAQQYAFRNAQPGTISRTITVIKTCASRHDPAVRKFVIGPQGIALDELPPDTEDSQHNDSGLASVPSP